MVAKWRHGLSFQYCRQSAAKINALLIGCLGRGRQWTLAVRKHDTRTVAQREDIGVIGCRQIRVYDDLPEPAVVQAIYRSDKLGRTHTGRPEFDGCLDPASIGQLEPTGLARQHPPLRPPTDSQPPPARVRDSPRAPRQGARN